MNKKMLGLLVFATGVLIGANWPKIKKTTDPYLKTLKKKSNQAYNKVVEFAAEQKEHIEDSFAHFKAKKKMAKKAAQPA